MWLEVLCELVGMVVWAVMVWVIYLIIFAVFLRIGLSERAITTVLAGVPILAAGVGLLLAHGLILKLFYVFIGLSPEVITIIWVKRREA